MLGVAAAPGDAEDEGLGLASGLGDGDGLGDGLGEGET
jgi:hypothetical protein